MQSRGWLFDVYPAHAAMVVWLYQEDGALLRLEDPFRPRLYAAGRREDLRALARATLRTRACSRCALTTRQEFWSGAPIQVLALEVADYAMVPRLLRRLPEFEARVTFYNCDIPLPQYYLYCRALFPFGQCLVEHDGRTIASIRACETNEALDYPIPPLRILELQLTEDPLIPLQRGNTLLLTLDGRSHEFTTHDPVELLRQLNAFLTREDPDLILTDYGDTAIFPNLLRLARRYRVPLAWDREPRPVERRIVSEGRSFFSYGKMLYHPPSIPCTGAGTSIVRTRFSSGRPDFTASSNSPVSPGCPSSAWPGPPSAPSSAPCSSTWPCASASSSRGARGSQSAGRPPMSC